MTKINRRSLLAALAAIPFVGRFMPPPRPRRPLFTIHYWINTDKLLSREDLVNHPVYKPGSNWQLKSFESKKVNDFNNWIVTAVYEEIPL